MFEPQEFLTQPLGFLSAVLVLGIFAQWIAWRLRLPSILLLLAFGFLTRYLGGANPDDVLGQDLLIPLVSLSVAVILFEGGLTLQLSELRESGRVVLRLVTIGVLVSWVMTWWAAKVLFGMDNRIAALTGAILVVTGPTVIAPLLRHVRPARRVASIVKWEGIVIDPIGVLLATLVFSAVFVAPNSDRIEVIVLILAKALLVGSGLALATGWLVVQGMKRYWIPDFLHNPVFLAVAILTFTISHVIQKESGLITVTLLGVVLANQKSVPVRHVIEFKETLRVLLISCLFIVLAARIDLRSVNDLSWRGLLFLAALIFVIRPCAVFVSTIRTELNWRERVFLAFLALRGIVAAAVSSVFVLEVTHLLGETADRLGTEQVVAVTFLVIVGTVGFYGLCAAPLARWLGLASPSPQGLLFAGAAHWIREVALALKQENVPVLMVDTNYRNIAAARMDGIPVYCASILSEFITEEMELPGIGRLLAVTPNDDLNRLATLEFSQDFGRAEVYQISPWEAGNGRRDASTPHIQGRYLFGEGITFGDLAARVAAGAKVKRTKITEEFTFGSFSQMYGKTAIVLFVKTESGQILVATAESPLEPKPGQTVIAMVDPVDEQSSQEDMVK